MSQVCIGIPVRERLDLLDSTLHALRSCTPTATVMVLADGLDTRSREALAHRICDRVVSSHRVLGDAACFNRMVTAHDAELYVLLENGARVAPHWLERLMRALAANEAHGLAGPSTNRSWNEQQQFPDRAGTATDLASTADLAARQHGDEFAVLTPLHSLGDFCYAVTRKVVEAIGAADEAYGDGPCWEMDFNIRAARARFVGVWAKSAYVWRAPETARRRAVEQRRFEPNKRLYQDRFCGLRLRQQTAGYDSHCTGEACPHFAPAELIRKKCELTHDVNLHADVRIAPTTAVGATIAKPLVSCIMPTANRRPFVPQAIAAFLRQDYAPRELVIIDDGTDNVEDLIPRDDRIRYVHSARRQSIGNKRNEACRLAAGDVIVHWDDDDWHAPWRLSYQVTELLAKNADICGLDRLWFYEPETRRAWQYRYPGGRSRWLAGGSFCYRRRLWERQHFSDVSVGEDTRFVRDAAFAKLIALERDDFYVARVHGANTCRKQTSGASWFAASRDAVEQMIALGAAASANASLPLISCIMPTCDRRTFVELALRRFAEQSYANKELIVIDDGTDPVESLVQATANARYLRLPSRRSIGEKRNAACAMALGELIAQWDDDDWYGPHRLDRQAAPILSARADVTGLRCRWLMTLPDGAFWQVSPELHRRMFVHDLHGGTLLFRKRLWESGARYPRGSLGEDAALLRAAIKCGARLEIIDNAGDFVYSRHGDNAWNFTAGQFIDPRQWLHAEPPPELDAETIASYCAASDTTAHASSTLRLNANGRR